MFEYLERQDKIDLIEFFDDILNPIANNFEVKSVSDYDIVSKIGDYPAENGREVWTDSPCLFAKLNYSQNNYNMW